MSPAHLFNLVELAVLIKGPDAARCEATGIPGVPAALRLQYWTIQLGDSPEEVRARTAKGPRMEVEGNEGIERPLVNTIVLIQRRINKRLRSLKLSRAFA